MPVFQAKSLFLLEIPFVPNVVLMCLSHTEDVRVWVVVEGTFAP